MLDSNNNSVSDILTNEENVESESTTQINQLSFTDKFRIIQEYKKQDSIYGLKLSPRSAREATNNNSEQIDDERIRESIVSSRISLLVVDDDVDNIEGSQPTKNLQSITQSHCFQLNR